MYWRQYDKHLALMTPMIEYRANGDKEAESSVKRLFTDRVLMEVPIVTMGPGGGPVIDVDAMLREQSIPEFLSCGGQLWFDSQWCVFHSYREGI